jgi:hypothetical protein
MDINKILQDEGVRFDCLALIIKDSQDLSAEQIIETAIKFENYIKNGGDK